MTAYGCLYLFFSFFFFLFFSFFYIQKIVVDIENGFILIVVLISLCNMIMSSSVS